MTDNPSALKHVYLSVYFEKEPDTKEEMLSRISTDPSWDTFDRVLTSGCFPKLVKVKITLQQHLTVFVDTQPRRDSTEDWTAREAAREAHFGVEAVLRSSFSRLMQKASISLELESIIHPVEAY